MTLDEIEKAARGLAKYGISIVDDDRARIEWLETWRKRLCRTFRHHGNHRYTWLLDRRAPREYGPERAYPKRRARAA